MIAAHGGGTDEAGKTEWVWYRPAGGVMQPYTGPPAGEAYYRVEEVEAQLGALHEQLAELREQLDHEAAIRMGEL